MVHKAFWDLLREQLEREPPSFDQAIRLLGEIKEDFPQLLSENNAGAMVRISAALDETLIRQQAERGVLDFRAYANFVINLLANLCCPARDEAVAKLREIDDVVDTFRAIFEVMSLMKLDMANFMLSAARNDIAAHSVEYEKEKFSNYLREFHGNGMGKDSIVAITHSTFATFSFTQLASLPPRSGCSVIVSAALAPMTSSTMHTCSC